MEVDGIPIPLEVEAAGGAAVDTYVAEQKVKLASGSRKPRAQQDAPNTSAE